MNIFQKRWFISSLWSTEVVFKRWWPTFFVFSESYTARQGSTEPLVRKCSCFRFVTDLKPEKPYQYIHIRFRTHFFRSWFLTPSVQAPPLCLRRKLWYEFGDFLSLRGNRDGPKKQIPYKNLLFPHTNFLIFPLLLASLLPSRIHSFLSEKVCSNWNHLFFGQWTNFS